MQVQIKSDPNTKKLQGKWIIKDSFCRVPLWEGGKRTGYKLENEQECKKDVAVQCHYSLIVTERSGPVQFSLVQSSKVRSS